MQQVDQICHQLRTKFRLATPAAAAESPAETMTETPLTDFRARREGPEYLFASTAALMLRSLGYSTRLVSGFYARPERYEPRRRQTPVHGEDVHFWCELLVGPGTWVTVEASPGYEVLLPPPGLLQRFSSAVMGLLQAAWRHWFVSGSSLAALVLCIRQRSRLRDALQTLLWRILPAADERERVRQTVRLVEQRLALAGLQRPAHVTLRRWMGELRLQQPAAVRQLVALADAAAFAESAWEPGVRADALQCCDQLQRQLSLHGFRRVAEQRRASTDGTLNQGVRGFSRAFRSIFPLRTLSAN